jgi:hypothetical protein
MHLCCVAVVEVSDSCKRRVLRLLGNKLDARVLARWISPQDPGVFMDWAVSSPLKQAMVLNVLPQLLNFTSYPFTVHFSS